MTLLLVASIAFLATHFVTSTPLRPALVRAIGEWPYRGVYSLGRETIVQPAARAELMARVWL